MTTPSSRLQTLSRRYQYTGEVSPIEAFQRAFSRYLKANRESLFDLTLTAASAQILLADGIENIDPLLLQAIRDTNPTLTEIHMFGLDDEALQGAVNTAKGKYFEYLVVERLNNGEQVGPLLLPEGFHAELADTMNQPGWDMRILDEDGAIADYLQLKATDSISYINETLERYPDIQILATHEVARNGLVLDSGLSNTELQEHVSAALDLADTSISERFLDYFSPILPLIIIASWEGYKVAVGKQTIDNFKLSLARRGQRIIASQLAGAIVYALDGGLLSIPAAFAGGIWFDRTINKTAVYGAYAAHREKLLGLRLQQQNFILKGRWQ